MGTVHDFKNYVLRLTGVHLGADFAQLSKAHRDFWNKLNISQLWVT